MRQASFGNVQCKSLEKYAIVCHQYIIFILMIGGFVVAPVLPPPTHCHLMGYSILEVSSDHVMNLLEGSS